MKTQCSIVEVSGKFQVSEVTILESRTALDTLHPIQEFAMMLGAAKSKRGNPTRYVETERRNAKFSRRNSRRARIEEKLAFLNS